MMYWPPGCPTLILITLISYPAAALISLVCAQNDQHKLCVHLAVKDPSFMFMHSARILISDSSQSSPDAKYK